ncbi:hypothetical protein MP228_008045 [Amoeboaphelidium protococcarum]|nr:hypothetical protein MP228_008045 [Amoeboaphelidium protococcarum]
MNAAADLKDFTFLLSNEVHEPLKLRISSIEGNLLKDYSVDAEETVQVIVSVYSGNNLVCLPVELSCLGHQIFQSQEVSLSKSQIENQGLLSGRRYNRSDNTALLPIYSHQFIQIQVDQIIEFPVMVCDLNQDSVLVCQIQFPHCDWTQAPLLLACSLNLFKSNRKMRRGHQRLRLYDNSDNQCGVDIGQLSLIDGKLGVDEKLNTYDKALKKYQYGDLMHIAWLDKLTMAEVQQDSKSILMRQKMLYVNMELMSFDFPVVYNESQYPLIQPQPPRNISGSVNSLSNRRYIYDPEALRENIVEAQHRRLVRSHRSGQVDKDLKPNAKNRDELMAICQFPPTRDLTPTEADLVWKFRFYLTKYPSAISKFIKAVDWSHPVESKQALEQLMPLWQNVDISDILELLGPLYKVQGGHRTSYAQIRRYAVKQLEKVDSSQLNSILSQLVQAIKFENLSADVMGSLGSAASSSGSGSGAIYESDLVEFLIRSGVKDMIVGNNLYWYLSLESEDPQYAKMYSKVSYQFMSKLMEQQSGNEIRSSLRQQSDFIQRLVALTKELRSMKEPRPKKIQWLKLHLADPDQGWLQFQKEIILPLDASVSITGVIPEESTIFKSNLMPIKLVFKTANTASGKYSLIFKVGDDLRQDQLVMQMIEIMDQMLKKENMDLKLTPYKVLATGVDHGLIQFIPSMALANVLSDYGNSLQTYFRSVAPAASLQQTADLDQQSGVQSKMTSFSSLDAYGIDPVVFDNYVKSCAGYCVITYILGIGDRHLDNLLVTPEGNLFHIDFGYFLGRDPKPFPPPMKISREMVDCMGGMNSVHFRKFKNLCFTIFMTWRRNAGMILNMFQLMVDANVPDIRSDPDKVVGKVLDKFRLDLNEEEAIQHLNSLINESVTALFPQLIETVHKFSQYWRK